MVWSIETDSDMVQVRMGPMTSHTSSKTSLKPTPRRGLPTLYRLPDPLKLPVPKKLDPYLNYSTLRLIQKQPNRKGSSAFSRSGRRNSRLTATGLCDPCQSLAMDRGEEVFPTIAEHSAMINSAQGGKERYPYGSISGSARSRNEGSTMLPKYPIVSVPPVELGSEAVYDKIHLLRRKIKHNLAFLEENKAKEDYKRTTQDFYRMHLDRFDKLHPNNVGRVKDIYLAYFTNTPGSKKAIYDCLENVDCASTEKAQ